ncbi:ABC1 kinase family protein [Winogradskyella alexanderae]|uniref:AarF/ABC1/UbiB kinase family protein n=1 Tax=Winogradskyella alexanderae TaxID=2877123 RepID=A0ABS7XVV8_9FLAO|nr:AarF/ABC1/UbiB kinase family protein [Winogradskyella alexanderae]MCA0133539.1 AarF/ABC1/UbiB kinase family protein [Winogradskyella alexanderae]
MKTLKKIPVSKIHRASKLVQTGAKVGVNYLKYYGDKIVNSELEAKERLNESNASDIYNSLSNLKGSALKLAQMLSMEKNFLPQAYVEKFSLSQFSVPPLSAPMVMKTFKKSFGKYPYEIFDEFNSKAINAASIGQVHKAYKDGMQLAVKIQYPGVADSILSDLAMIKPIAMKMFNIKGEHSDVYFKEVEAKLLEETNYLLEIKQSQEVLSACNHIPNIKFPNYYSDLSSEQIITMDWMEGIHLSEFTKVNVHQDVANTLGQALWDFYLFQIHKLKKVHADPHPGNFLVSASGQLIVLDFGCMKTIPEAFYAPYFDLFDIDVLENPDLFHEKLLELEILREEDGEEETAFFTTMFHDVLSFFTQPFREKTFNFSDPVFFEKTAAIGERYFKDTRSNNMNSNRGSRHFIYMNRTFFGLFNLMFDLKAENIEISNYKNL